MKLRLVYFSSLSLICSVLLSGCTLSRLVKLSKKQQVTVIPHQLEVSGDNILFEVKAQVPLKMVQKKAVYGLELTYKYGEAQEDAVGRIAFTPGEFVYENDRPTITRQFSIPYTPEKNPGQLLMQGVASNKKRHEKRTSKQELAKGLITTSKLVARNNEVTYELDNFEPEKESFNTLTFYFDKGQTALRDFLGTNVSVLNDFIEANYKTESIEIIAGTSPEKEELQKPRLAAQRVQVLQRFYKHKLDVSDYVNNTKAITFKPTPLRQSWDSFIKKVKSSALPKEEVDKILAIVNGEGSFLEKEEKLQQLESYEYLELYVYPVLRFAEVKIAYSPVLKKNYEIYLLSKKIVEKAADKSVLTDQELRYAATLTPLLAEKQKIYEAAIRTTDHWQAYHNLGVVYLLMAKQEHRPQLKNELLKKSAQNLIYASHRNPAARTFYHAASAHHLRGNALEALQAYDYAIKLGGNKEILEKVFADKAALEIEIGQIDDALTSLRFAGTTYQNYINKGLCYMLKENYDDSPKFYEEALKLKPNDALAYYSLAIIAARVKDENLMAAHLKRAVQADKSFVQRAINDLEFRPYLKKDYFQAALKR
ncbi:tetratricopeptide repeat protein [Adhaeribacter rhizoryzae]|uniref:Tetratricopeptide repeat protein n=1 Tax=Adhaeribacter rhizoryzae TaxID=2607907 RepID=A0A5M6DEL8_9BACT|nr:tetratricopeptide repeat protein [Adhaeribacter rhizoryzae]KAA5544742.1 tetratricopeptide repeat protein [Adhaeribacter rhizoryzae]